MPIYEYECDQCQHHFELEQSMKEDPISTCPQCEGKVRRIFSASSIIFKGSGFYSTDSRAPQGEKKSSEACATCPVNS